MTRCRLLIVLGLSSAVLIGGLADATVAQEATPDVACAVEPRAPEEVQSVMGSPPAPDLPALAAELPEGESVDAETVAALEETVELVRACAEAGDLPRLLALYSDDYIAAEVAPTEATPIVPGQPPEEAGTLPAGSPVPPAAPTVREAHLLPDGRIAAEIVTGDRVELVLFRYDEERQFWQIDGVVALTTESTTPAADQPAAVDAALADAAAQLGVDAAELTVTTVEAREWPDASLGCPKPDEVYAQVITPGYLIVVEAAGQALEYHGDEHGNVVLCEDEAS
ncbi:MAG: hypothetical protein ACRDJW_19460 [Thermomicrobiales bacterium]